MTQLLFYLQCKEFDIIHKWPELRVFNGSSCRHRMHPFFGHLNNGELQWHPRTKRKTKKTACCPVHVSNYQIKWVHFDIQLASKPQWNHKTREDSWENSSIPQTSTNLLRTVDPSRHVPCSWARHLPQLGRFLTSLWVGHALPIKPKERTSS